MSAADPAAWAGAERVRFGRGLARQELDAAPRPLALVTGAATLSRCGWDDLRDAPDVTLVEGVAPLPGEDTVDAIAERLRESAARTIVALGGGSVLDATKAAAVVAATDNDTASTRARLAAGEDVLRDTTLVAVPTTAGTGSEVTRWSSLWDAHGDKCSFDAAAGLPDLALVDPSLTDGMDAALTAATGLDALAHAVEALWGTARDARSDVHATRALGLVAAHLLPVVEAVRAGRAAPRHRDGMAAASLSAGLALARTASAVAHALSYPLTGRHGVPHGLAVGLLCKGAATLQAQRDPGCLARILPALGVDDVSGLVAFVDRVCAAAGVPSRLADHGVPASAVADAVATARGSERLANAGGRPSDDELAAVVEAVL